MGKNRAIERHEIMHRLFEKCGVVCSDRAIKMFNIAWEHGHASGEHDIENWIRELKPLISLNCCESCYVDYCSDEECECHTKKSHDH